MQEENEICDGCNKIIGNQDDMFSCLCNNLFCEECVENGEEAFNCNGCNELICSQNCMHPASIDDGSFLCRKCYVEKHNEEDNEESL